MGLGLGGGVGAGAAQHGEQEGVAFHGYSPWLADLLGWQASASSVARNCGEIVGALAIEPVAEAVDRGDRIKAGQGGGELGAA